MRVVTVDDRIDVFAGDITTLAVDAIVNAANEALTPGGGVCGAIHRAAGPGLAGECRGVGGCPTGDARITGGYDLPAKHVIHAIGPVWHGGEQGEPALLAGCYRASFALLRQHGLTSIAFPAISTGIFGYPLAAATKIAVASVRDELATSRRSHAPQFQRPQVQRPQVQRVVFCTFGAEVTRAYQEALGR